MKITNQYFIKYKRKNVLGSEILSEKQMILIGVLVVFFIAFIVIVNLLDNRSLNGIKAKNVGHGQYGVRP